MSKIKVTEHWDNPKAIRIDIYEQFVEVKLPSRRSRIHFTKDEWVALADYLRSQDQVNDYMEADNE